MKVRRDKCKCTDCDYDCQERLSLAPDSLGHTRRFKICGRSGETGAGEQSAAANENSHHDHGLQNLHPCVVRLPRIDRESRGNQQ